MLEIIQAHFMVMSRGFSRSVGECYLVEPVSI